MIVELLLEERSAEVALTNLIPKIRGDVQINARVFQGKPDLLGKLPARLAAYSKRLTKDLRIVVLIDEDREDCIALKQELEDVASSIGLTTASTYMSYGYSFFHVLNRIAVEELEAWFFGDVDAIVAAYPKVPMTLGDRARYRIPDAIRGGTAEALERVFKEAGYYRGGLPKIETARNISKYMDPNRNRSKSFQVFRDGLLKLWTRK